MALRGTVLLLLAALLARPARAGEEPPRFDPDYAAVLEAWKAKRWEELDRRAARFLEEKPTYRYAHSVRYMIADSLRKRGRLAESAAAFEEYLAHHPGASRADQCRAALVQVLNRDRRHARALERATELLAGKPAAKYAGAIAWERAVALEGLRRFDEAVAAYRGFRGDREEHAAYRIGVALFRGRRFDEARKALLAFLERYPDSKRRASAKDYLFRTETGFARIEGGIVLDYRGKYEGDPRLAAIRATLPRRRAEALARIRDAIGEEVPGTFLIRLSDAGTDRSGRFAQTRLEVVGGEPREVVILFTEYLVTGAHDLDRTLTHELYHCLQRARLREAHYETPVWAREGAALFVAGQGPERTRILAAEVGRRTGVTDPLARLVNGLPGRHTLDDYAEDVAAFDAALARHGREKTVRLLRRLLETPDAAAAVRDALGEDLATFERAAAAQARAAIGPLVGPGREGILRAFERLRERNFEGVLEALPEEPGAYAPVALFLEERALLETGRAKEALPLIRAFLARHRAFATLLDNVLYDEVRALAALGSEEYAGAVDRANRDLEPMGVWGTFRKYVTERE